MLCCASQQIAHSTSAPVKRRQPVQRSDVSFRQMRTLVSSGDSNAIENYGITVTVRSIYSNAAANMAPVAAEPEKNSADPAQAGKFAL